MNFYTVTMFDDNFAFVIPKENLNRSHNKLLEGTQLECRKAAIEHNRKAPISHMDSNLIHFANIYQATKGNFHAISDNSKLTYFN